MKYPGLILTWLCGLTALADTISLPRTTAYPELTSGGSQWVWYGQFQGTGNLSATIHSPRLANAPSHWQLELDQTTPHPGQVAAMGDDLVSFGSFVIDSPGYHQLTLSSTATGVLSPATIPALELAYPASLAPQFNLSERPNAASVHWRYPTPGMTNIDAFYCEVTGEISPPGTYFEACGWHRGYFGMQIISPTERRVIFSVWDSGQEAKDRAKVAANDRVKLESKAPDVYAGDFGNEGTGGHSHLVYPWRDGEPQRFLVTAQVVDATHTRYTGYWFQPEPRSWRQIARWLAPHDGQYLHDWYSFAENFAGQNGQQLRRARYGNQWFHTTDGQWREQTQAIFTTDDHGRRDRLDRSGGVAQGEFFLSTGGFIPGSTPYGEPFTRPATGKLPGDLAEVLEKDQH